MAPITASRSGTNSPNRLASKPAPQQRQREVVGQELRVEVDERRARAASTGTRMRRGPATSGRTARSRAAASTRAEELDHRIARRDRRAAGRALAAQHEPGQDRDVLARAVILCPHDGTGGARHDEVVARLRRRAPRRAAPRTASCQPRSSIFGRRWMTTLRKLPTHKPDERAADATSGHRPDRRGKRRGIGVASRHRDPRTAAIR